MYMTAIGRLSNDRRLHLQCIHMCAMAKHSKHARQAHNDRVQENAM